MKGTQPWVWAFFTSSCLVFITFMGLYARDELRRQDRAASKTIQARDAAARAKAEQDEDERFLRELSSKRLLQLRDEAWKECVDEGNTPVPKYGMNVVCIKKESIAWEQEPNQAM